MKILINLLSIFLIIPIFLSAPAMGKAREEVKRGEVKAPVSIKKDHQKKDSTTEEDKDNDEDQDDDEEEEDMGC